MLGQTSAVAQAATGRRATRTRRRFGTLEPGGQLFDRRWIDRARGRRRPLGDVVVVDDEQDHSRSESGRPARPFARGSRGSSPRRTGDGARRSPCPCRVEVGVAVRAPRRLRHRRRGGRPRTQGSRWRASLGNTEPCSRCPVRKSSSGAISGRVWPKTSPASTSRVATWTVAPTLRLAVDERPHKLRPSVDRGDRPKWMFTRGGVERRERPLDDSAAVQEEQLAPSAWISAPRAPRWSSPRSTKSVGGPSSSKPRAGCRCAFSACRRRSKWSATVAATPRVSRRPLRRLPLTTPPGARRVGRRQNGRVPTMTELVADDRDCRERVATRLHTQHLRRPHRPRGARVGDVARSG